MEYDQLDACNLACFELICRELQMIEDRHAERLFQGDEQAKEKAEEYSILMSIQSSTTCMSPKLKEFLANELSKQAAVLKERRKAREKRVLARTPKNGGAKGKEDDNT